MGEILRPETADGCSFQNTDPPKLRGLQNAVIHGSANAPGNSSGCLEETNTSTEWRDYKSMARGETEMPENIEFTRTLLNMVPADGRCGTLSKAVYTSHSSGAEPADFGNGPS